MRLFFPLSGDDVFISYSRRDGALYAAGLADKLTEKKLSCFIDKLGTEPNHDLPPSLRKKIKSCSVFVLIGTEKAAHSAFVQKEIAEFKQTGRTILPIDFNGSVGKSIWYEEIPGLAVETEKNKEALETGNPSQNVVGFIEKSFNYTRRNQYMSRMFWGALSLFFILIGLGVGSYLFAMNQANSAKQEADKQTKRAEEQTEIANNAEKRASEQEQIAQDKELLANAATKKADEAGKLADQKNKLALEKTKLADEKTKVADAETKRANEEKQKADEQAKIAEAKRKEAEIQGERSRQLTYATNLQLGSRLYKSGQIDDLDDVLRETDDDLKGFEWNYLNHLNEGLIKFDDKEDDIVGQIIFSPDGKYLVADGTVFSAQTGKDLTETIFGPDKFSDSSFSASAAAFSPDGKWFAACDGSLLYLWKTDTNPWSEIPIDLTPDPTTPDLITKVMYKQIASFVDPLEDYKFVSFNQDSSELLIVSTFDNEWFLRQFKIDSQKEVIPPISLSKKFDKDLKVLNFGFDGQLLVTYTIENKIQTSLYNPDSGENKLPEDFSFKNAILAFSSDGKTMAYLYNHPRKKTISANILKGVPLEDTDSSDDWIQIALSPNGFLLAALNKSEVRIWNLVFNSRIRTIPLKKGVAKSIVFSPDSRKIVVGEFDDWRGYSNLTLWDTYYPADIFNFNNEMPLAVSSDGASAVTFRNKDVNLWNTFKQESIKIATTPLLNEKVVNFSPDGNYLATFIREGDTAGIKKRIILNTRFGNEIILKSKNDCIFTKAIAFSPDSKKLVDICEDGTLRVWDVKNGDEIDKFVFTEKGVGENLRDTLKDDQRIKIFLTDNKLIVLYSDGQIISAWNINDKQELSLKICSEKILQYSPNGKWLITKDDKNDYRLRKESNKQCNQEPLESDDDGIKDFAFSDDSRYLAGYYTSTQGSVSEVTPFLIDLTDKPTLNAVPGGVLDSSLSGGVYFSKSKRWVLFGNRIFDRVTGNINKIVGCTQNPVFSENTSINLSRLITSCGDGTLKFFSLISGQEVLSMEAHGSEVTNTILMKDNAYLLTTSKSLIKLWKTKF